MSEPARIPVVYTMGKVGSTAATWAMRSADIHSFDIHSLNKAYLVRTAQEWTARGEFPPPHVSVSMAFRDQLFLKRKRCLYISLVREPISRNLSAYFQNLWLRGEDVKNESDATRLFENFLENYPHHLPLNWFDNEFKGELGIDIYNTPFDPEKKFKYLPSKNTLLMRVDCPDEIKARVLSKALGQTVQVERQNDSSNKDYNERYRAVRGVARFPRELLDRIYGSRFARHFWSEAEIAGFYDTWLAS